MIIVKVQSKPAYKSALSVHPVSTFTSLSSAVVLIT